MLKLNSKDPTTCDYAEAIYAQVDKIKKTKKDQPDNSFELDSPPPVIGVNNLEYKITGPSINPEVACYIVQECADMKPDACVWIYELCVHYYYIGPDILRSYYKGTNTVIQ